MEFNDIYDKDRHPTGRVHKRGTPWKKDEFGLVVCVWVYNDCGQLLLTRRAPEKSFAGTWENSGGAAKAGETSREAVARELFEETGIQATEDEFRLIETGRNWNSHYDFYCIHRNIATSTMASAACAIPGRSSGFESRFRDGERKASKLSAVTPLAARILAARGPTEKVLSIDSAFSRGKSRSLHFTF